MRSGVRRSVEVDFIRGVVLIVIAIDHVSGSALAKFTLHGYAFCDAAEVFVFLAGYASAAGYEAIGAKHGHDAARRGSGLSGAASRSTGPISSRPV